MKLYHSYNLDIANTYIIYVPASDVSVSMATRCLQSCMKIKQKAELWEGFDGRGNDIVPPEHLIGQSWLEWFRVTDHRLSRTEVACALSHISLWIKCIELDQPIVILEHDAIMVKPYTHHDIYNAISYLGCIEQYTGQYNTNYPEAQKSSINKNWHFIHRAHAYSIDPAVARKMVINVLDRGIFESLDIMIKSDDYALYQMGFYAYEKNEGQTTIFSRKKDED